MKVLTPVNITHLRNVNKLRKRTGQHQFPDEFLKDKYALRVLQNYQPVTCKCFFCSTVRAMKNDIINV